MNKRLKEIWNKLREVKHNLFIKHHVWIILFWNYPIWGSWAGINIPSSPKGVSPRRILYTTCKVCQVQVKQDERTSLYSVFVSDVKLYTWFHDGQTLKIYRRSFITVRCSMVGIFERSVNVYTPSSLLTGLISSWHFSYFLWMFTLHLHCWQVKS